MQHFRIRSGEKNPDFFPYIKNFTLKIKRHDFLHIFSILQSKTWTYGTKRNPIFDHSTGSRNSGIRNN